MDKIKVLNGLRIMDTSAGMANGIASLSEDGKIPRSQIPLVHSASDLSMTVGETTTLTEWQNRFSELNVWNEQHSWSDYLGIAVLSAASSETDIIYAVKTSNNAELYKRSINGIDTLVFSAPSATTVTIKYLGNDSWQADTVRYSNTYRYLSVDNGVTWTLVNFNCIFVTKHGTLTLCVEGNSAAYHWTEDGTTFTRVALPGVSSTTRLQKLQYFNNCWYFITDYNIMYSLDGKTNIQTEQFPYYSKTPGFLFNIAGTDYCFVEGDGYGNSLLYRYAEHAWRWKVDPSMDYTGRGNTLYINGYWYQVRRDTLKRSKNLSNWETCSLPITPPDIYIIDYAGGVYFFLTGSAIYASTDGVSFSLLHTTQIRVTYAHSAYNTPFFYYKKSALYIKGIWYIFKDSTSLGFTWSKDLVEWHDEATPIAPEYPSYIYRPDLGRLCASDVYCNKDITYFT